MFDWIEKLGLLIQTPTGQAIVFLSGFLVAGVGFLLKSLILPKREETRSLRYGGQTLRIISADRHAIPGLEVSVGGRKIPQVSVTNLALWNHGKTPIRQPHDIAPADRIRILIPENVNILHSDILYASREACKISAPVTESSKEIEVNFDFLEYGDGLVLRLVHDGNVQTAKFSVVGTVIGGEPIRLWYMRSGGERLKIRGVVVARKTLETAAAFSLVGVITISAMIYHFAHPIPPPWNMVVMAVGMGMFFGVQTLLNVRWRRLYPEMPAAIADHLTFERVYRPALTIPTPRTDAGGERPTVS